MNHNQYDAQIRTMNLFLTNGKGYGPVDPAQLAKWNNFVASQNRNKAKLG